MISFFKVARRPSMSKMKITRYILYAFGEIILVVVGILIALQIDEKVQNSRERDLERFYIDELRTALQQDTVALTRLIRTYNNGERSAAMALIVLEAKPTRIPDALEFVNNLQSSCNYNFNDLPSHTWDELKMSGNLRLITKRDLVTRLSSYYSFRENIFKSGHGEFETDILAGHMFIKERLNLNELNDLFKDLKIDSISSKTISNIMADANTAKLMKRLMVSNRMISRQMKALHGRTCQLLETLEQEVKSRR
jgi:hypothetical protein